MDDTATTLELPDGRAAPGETVERALFEVKRVIAGQDRCSSACSSASCRVGTC